MNPGRVSRYIISAFISIFFVQIVVADEWDPVDDTGTNATLLVLDETSQTHGPHSLDATDTEDWFQVYLTVGIPCYFESSGTLDTKATLYSDAAGTTQVEYDNQSGETNNFLLRHLPTASGTYYLKVQEHIAGGAGDSYTLHYGYYSADEWDPVDNVGTNGTLLAMGEAAKIHGTHVLDGLDEYDWFRINLSSGVVYRFESTGDSDTYGSLYSDPSAASEVDNDDIDYPNNANFRFDYPAPSDGTYYLMVQTWDAVANYELLYYIPANDSEPDQLPDSWEIQYFTDLTHEPSGLEGDSDPYSNLEEYIAGTDPTNAASFFAVTNWSTGSFVVEWWPSVAEREYKVFWTDSLTNGFQQIGPMIDHPQNSYTDTAHSAESSGFYKVEVQLK